MRNIIIAAILAVSSSAAASEPYLCSDSKGRKTVQDVPCNQRPDFSGPNIVPAQKPAYQTDSSQRINCTYHRDMEQHWRKRANAGFDTKRQAAGRDEMVSHRDYLRKNCGGFTP
jgi:hypothetical protein